jgi:hypothetical protein
MRSYSDTQNIVVDGDFRDNSLVMVTTETIDLNCACCGYCMDCGPDEIASLTPTVVISGVVAGSCADCNSLNGAYVLSLISQGPTYPTPGGVCSFIYFYYGAGICHESQLGLGIEWNGATGQTTFTVAPYGLDSPIFSTTITGIISCSNGPITLPFVRYSNIYGDCDWSGATVTVEL